MLKIVHLRGRRNTVGAHSYSKLLYHFTWTTWDREPILTGDLQEAVYNQIRLHCSQISVQVIALGGVADHIHLLASLNSKHRIADVVQHIKGSTAREINQLNPKCPIKWRIGYGVHTVSASHLTMITRYIERQEEHHAQGKTWSSAEPPERFDHRDE